MTSIIEQVGYFLVSPFVLDIPLHAATTVYSCGNGNYTSEPNFSYAQAQLPKISGYQGSGYHLNIRSFNAFDERVNVKPKRKKRTEKSNKQEKKANKPSKDKDSAKAEKQQSMSSEQEQDAQIQRISLTQTMKEYLPILSLLPLVVFSGQAHTTKIYTCGVNGSIVYTSRSSDNCQAISDLPIVDKYSGSRYDVPVSDASILDVPASQTAPAKGRSTAAKSNHKATPKPAPTRTTSGATPPPVPKPAGVNNRRSILGAELSDERAASANAKK